MLTAQVLTYLEVLEAGFHLEGVTCLPGYRVWDKGFSRHL